VELEHEIRWKSRGVTTRLLIQAARFHSKNRSQIAGQDYTLVPNAQD
jgi:hypothetical protein